MIFTDARGVVTNYAYDDAGRMLSRSYPATPAFNVAYGWDSIASGNKGKGRLTSVIDHSGSTSWVYDARGNAVSETRVIGSNSYVTSYAYDLADRVIAMTLPSGRIVSYARNGVGEVTAVTMKKDAVSAVDDVASDIAWQPMAGLVASFTYGNGLSFTTVYDQNYRLTTYRVKNGTNSIINRTES